MKGKFVAALRYLTMIIGVLLVVVISWAGIESTFDWTNTTEFCISCHEMEVTVYEEFLGSIHDVNVAGVRTSCADCHVPKPVFRKMIAKIKASKDLLHHFLGTVDTPEKFEANRLHMAEKVWDYMKATDSRECRNCHVFDAMDLAGQNGRAARKHEEMHETGETCIDCHKGEAHELPMDYEEGTT